MKLIGLTLVGNDADIIEASLRHNLRFVDRLVVGVHAPLDGTDRIVEALRQEGLPLDLLTIDEPQFNQCALTARLVRRALSDPDVDWLLPLDADEFIEADSADSLRARLAGIADHALWRWRTHVPTADDPAGESLPWRRLAWRYADPPPTAYDPMTCKALVNVRCMRQRGERIGRGSHFLIADDGQSRVDAPYTMLDDAFLRHFPLRSPEQAALKATITHLATRVAGVDTPAVQISTMFELLLRQGRFTPADLEGLCNLYAFDNLRRRAPTPVIHDSFTADPPIRYAAAAKPPLAALFAWIERHTEPRPAAPAAAPPSAALAYQIVVVRPQGLIYARAFDEVLELLRDGFAELGLTCPINVNRIDPGAVPIVVGAHLLAAEDLARLPDNSILYNLEHLVPGYPFFSESYIELLSRFRVWDFHRANVDLLHRGGHPATQHVPIGYMPALSRIAPVDEDVDILFFGLLTARRRRILDLLVAAGLRITVLDRVYGGERDAWIARARLVLDLHMEDGGLFNAPRIALLLANRKAVVCEAGPGIDPDLAPGLAAVPLAAMAETCQRLLAAPEQRHALAERGYAAMTVPRRRMSALLAHALRPDPDLRLVPAGADSGHARFLAEHARYAGERGPDYRDYAAHLRLDLPFERIAFYLPQFHRIPENDAFWGDGFTEWSNVSRALPRFAGHQQPRRPGELGYYDLHTPGVIARQVALARNYGLSGFMFFFYWLDGRPLLEAPLRAFLDDAELDFGFHLMWANEHWTRRWDGRDDEVLLRQTYDPATQRAMIRHLLPYFADRRYLKSDGRPVLTIYRPQDIPDLEAFRAELNTQCAAAGIANPYLIAALTGTGSPSACVAAGFDAALEYPPHCSRPLARAAVDLGAGVDRFDPAWTGEVFDYADFVASRLSAPPASERIFPTACPGWDNSARRRQGSMTLTGASPALFAAWLRAHCASALGAGTGLRMVCINAWNEWAEAAYLEPDTYSGYAYLEAMHSAFADFAPPGGRAESR